MSTSSSLKQKSNHHKTQEPIDDFLYEEEQNIEYTNETTYVKPSFSLKNRAWKKSQKDMPKLKHDLKYGQYLTVPKSQRTIFNRHSRRKTNQLILLIGLVAILALVIWRVFTAL